MKNVDVVKCVIERECNNVDDGILILSAYALTVVYETKSASILSGSIVGCRTDGIHNVHVHTVCEVLTHLCTQRCAHTCTYLHVPTNLPTYYTYLLTSHVSTQKSRAPLRASLLYRQVNVQWSAWKPVDARPLGELHSYWVHNCSHALPPGVYPHHHLKVERVVSVLGVVSNGLKPGQQHFALACVDGDYLANILGLVCMETLSTTATTSPSW